jgi:hypothetical protein
MVRARTQAVVAKGKTPHDLHGPFATRLMRAGSRDRKIDEILEWGTSKSQRPPPQNQPAGRDDFIDGAAPGRTKPGERTAAVRPEAVIEPPRMVQKSWRSEPHPDGKSVCDFLIVCSDAERLTGSADQSLGSLPSTGSSPIAHYERAKRRNRH